MPRLSLIQTITQQSHIAKRRANKLPSIIRKVEHRLNERIEEDGYSVIAFYVFDTIGNGFTYEEILSIVEEMADDHEVNCERELKYLKTENAEVYK